MMNPYASSRIFNLIWWHQSFPWGVFGLRLGECPAPHTRTSSNLYYKAFILTLWPGDRRDPGKLTGLEYENISRNHREKLDSFLALWPEKPNAKPWTSIAMGLCTNGRKVWSAGGISAEALRRNWNVLVREECRSLCPQRSWRHTHCAPRDGAHI